MFHKRHSKEKVELYCLRILQGMTHQDAFRSIGACPNSNKASFKKSSQRFYKTLRVQEVLAGLRKEFLSHAVMTIEERRVRASEIGRAQLTDYVDEDGNIRLTQTSPNKGAIAEYAVRERKYGTDRDIKLLNPLQAIDLLNKMDGIYDDRPINQDIKILVVYDNGSKNNQTLAIQEGSNGLE